MSSVLHIKHKQILKGTANGFLLNLAAWVNFSDVHVEHYYVVLLAEEPDPLRFVGVVAFSVSSLTKETAVFV